MRNSGLANMDVTSSADLRCKAKLRLLQMHYESGVGHLGGNLSALDILLCLYHFILRKDDLFVLSKGHGAGALYVALWSVGALTDDDLRQFHKDGTRLSGHPPAAGIPEIIFATGSLGHGLGLACGKSGFAIFAASAEDTDPGGGRLTVGPTVEYLPQRGNHPGRVGFGVASGHQWSGQTGAGKPFCSNSGGPSRIHKTPSGVRDRGSRSAGLPKASGRRGRRCGMGTGGIVAAAIGRGEVRLYRFPHPDKQRPVVVLTRDSAIGYLSAVTVAPITSTIRGVPSEVLLTEKDGMKARCAINLHNVVTVSKAHLGRRVAMLSSERLREICGALGFALGCA